MSDTSLIFSIFAKDKASKVIGKIGDKAKVALAAAAASALAISKDAIQAASDLSETQNKVSVLFGKSAGQVQAFAAKAEKALGQSKVEALNAASTFALYGKQAGLSGNKLVGFSTKLTTLASDMASFSNTSPQEAIEAIGSALRGESDPIEKYGVLLNQTSIAARALSMGLVKANVDQTRLRTAQLALTEAQAKYTRVMKDGNATSLDRAKASNAVQVAQARIKNALGGTVPQLTSQQRVLAATAEIYAQTSAAQGDFSRTSNSLANRQRILAAEWENSRAKLGQGLLPVLLKFSTVLQATITYVQGNHRWLVPLVAVIGGLAGILFIVVKATKAWTAVQAALNVVMDMNPVVAIVAGIVLLVGAIVLIATKTRWFQAVWHAAWGGIKGAAGDAVHWVTGKFDALVGFIKGMPGKISNAATGMWDGVKDAFRSSINWVISKWNNLHLTIPGVNTHIPGVGMIGGFTLSTPNIPLLASGGDVLSTGLAVIHQGERVVPAAQARRMRGGGATVIELRSDGTRMGDLLVELLRHAIRVKGGNVQFVLGR